MIKDIEKTIVLGNIAVLIAGGLLFIPKILANIGIAVVVNLINRLTRYSHPVLYGVTVGFWESAGLVVFLCVFTVFFYSETSAEEQILMTLFPKR